MRVVQWAFTFAVTVCVFSLVAAVGLALWVAWAEPLKAQEAECIISRETYTRHSIAAGHESLGDMPQRQVPAFIAAFNANPPAVKPSDAVVVFRWAEEQPVYRLAFFMKNCLVDVYDLPAPVLMRMLGEARQGDGI